MAKGRRLTTSRSERLLGTYAYGDSRNPTVGSDIFELREEDVWSMADDVHNSKGEYSPRSRVESNGGESFRSRGDGHLGGLSWTLEGSSDKKAAPRIVHQFRGHDSSVASSPRQMATSAPVNVPDWRKIYRVDSVESLHGSDDGFDDEGESEVVPPHEYLAREYGGSRKMGGTSVFEGVGRTLKGRDMWRVRDAVWSQTGFDG